MTQPPRYGQFELYPAIYNDYEAYILVNGEWKEIDSADILHVARPMTEAQFNDRFGQVPALPKTAFQSAS